MEQQANQQQHSVEKGYKPNLINAMEAGNKHEISLILKEYKLQNGAINFPAIFSISSKERLPVLAKEDFGRMVAVLTTGIALSIESMNLVRGMNNSQIIDLAETILDSSSEDNLSLEDVMLFLQKLVRGEYGKLYESMDIPKFMEMFELYREERFKAMMIIRDEQAANYRPDYSDVRLSEQEKNKKKTLHLKAILDYQTGKI